MSKLVEKYKDYDKDLLTFELRAVVKAEMWTHCVVRDKDIFGVFFNVRTL